jgi:hypothetical protein
MKVSKGISEDQCIQDTHLGHALRISNSSILGIDKISIRNGNKTMLCFDMAYKHVEQAAVLAATKSCKICNCLSALCQLQTNNSPDILLIQ